MKRGLFPMFAICWALIICMVAAAQGNQTKSAPTANVQETASDESAEGEKLFHTHCGRCHNAPESISPREARAVVRHMRVRSTLTNEDERLILKFLAP